VNGVNRGIVLESWSRWAIYGVLDDQELRYMALQFLKQLGEAFPCSAELISRGTVFFSHSKSATAGL
jgi:hypothetical protein